MKEFRVIILGKAKPVVVSAVFFDVLNGDLVFYEYHKDGEPGNGRPANITTVFARGYWCAVNEP